MQKFTGIYSYDSPDNIQKADITVTNKRIGIHLKDADGNPRVVYWYWYNVIKGNNGQWHHTGQPQQTLKVNDYAFEGLADKQLRKKRRSPVIPFLIGFVTFIIALLLIAYFWLIPFLARRTADALPVDYEIKMGEQAYRSMAGEFKIAARQTALANDFFQSMDIRSRYPIQITVVERDELNAFAVPGGHIVVFTGLLDKMDDAEEFEALLAHEYSHIALRHTTRTLMQSLGTYMIASLLFGDLSGVAAVVAENAQSLQHLKYSRDLEKEADMNGVKLLEERKIDLHGFVSLFNTLKEGGGAQPSEWLSSHPDLSARIAYVQERLEKQNERVMKGSTTAIWNAIKGGY